MRWRSRGSRRGGVKEPHGPPQLQLQEQIATASLHSTATPLGEILVYLVRARPYVRAHGQATTMVTMSPYLKQHILVWLLQLLACLSFPCVCLPEGFFLCLPMCSRHAWCRACEGVRAMQQHDSPLHISMKQQGKLSPAQGHLQVIQHLTQGSRVSP